MEIVLFVGCKTKFTCLFLIVCFRHVAVFPLNVQFTVHEQPQLRLHLLCTALLLYGHLLLILFKPVEESLTC